MSDTWSWRFNPLLRPVETYDAPGEHRFFQPMRTRPEATPVVNQDQRFWEGDGDWVPTSVGRGALTSTGDFSRDLEMISNDSGTMNALMALATGPVGAVSIALGTLLNQAAGVPGVNSLGGFLLDRARELDLTPEQVTALREAQQGQYNTQQRLSDDRQTTREDLAPISSTLNQNVTSLLDTTGQTATNVASTADTGNVTKTASDVTSLLDTGTTDLTTSKGPGTTAATTDTGSVSKTLTDLGNVVNPNITSLLDVYPADGEDATGVTGDFGMGDKAAGFATDVAEGRMTQQEALNAMAQTVSDLTGVPASDLAAMADQLGRDVAEGKVGLNEAIASMMADVTAAAPATASAPSDEDTDDEAAAQSVADAMAEAQAAADEAAAAEAAAAADAEAADAAAADAAASDAAGEGAGEGDGDGDGGDGDGGDGSGGDGSGDGGGDGGGGDGGGDGGGYRKGGLVKGKKKNAPIKATVHVGEYVLRPEAVNMYGLGLLNAINEQRIPKRRFTGLLGD